MPHLAPMNWILVPMFMILTLMIMSSILWWQFNPQFPSLTNAATMKYTKKWSW